MKAVKFFRNFSAVILIILFGFVLAILMSVLLTRDLLSEQSIAKYIEASEIFDSRSEEVFNEEEGTNNTLREEITSKLIKIGISENITNEALNSPEMDNILSSYVSDYIDYLLFNKERPMFPSDKVVNVINDQVNKNNRVLNANETKLLNDYIKNLSSKVDSTIPSVYQLNNMGYDAYSIRLMSAIIFSSQILIGLILILTLLTVLIGICLWSKLKAIKNIAIPILLIGVLLVIGGFMEVRLLNMFINSEGLIDGIILNVMSKSFEKLLIYGSILIAIGIIILIVCGIIIKKGKKSKKEAVFNNPLTPSAKDNLKDHVITPNSLKENELPQITNEELPEITNNNSELIKPLEIVKEEKEVPEITISTKKEEENIKEIAPQIINETMPEQENKEPELENNETKMIEQEVPKEEMPKEKNNELETIELEEVEEKPETTKQEEYNPDKYIEMDEEVPEIIKKEPDIIKPQNIDINIISPKKGKDIKIELDKEEEEEEIEIL